MVETLFGEKLLEVSVGRDLGGSKGGYGMEQLETLFGEKLLEVSIGRDLGGS